MRPGMSDGRAFTDYRSNCMMNTKIQTENNINNDASYRSFLQQNATKIMEQYHTKEPKA